MRDANISTCIRLLMLATNNIPEELDTKGKCTQKPEHLYIVSAVLMSVHTYIHIQVIIDLNPHLLNTGRTNNLVQIIPPEDRHKFAEQKCTTLGVVATLLVGTCGGDLDHIFIASTLYFVFKV